MLLPITHPEGTGILRTANMNGKKILFVEDEPVAQSVYQNRLQRGGFETLFAKDGEVALSSLSQGRPDLLVLDLLLPGVKGEEVLRRIRSEDRLKEMPVLILSNDHVAGLSQRAMESGATRGMLKAECTPARLLETVRDMLGYASAFDLSDKPVTDESQSQAFAAAAEEAFADEVNLKETRAEFIRKAPAEVASIREHCLAYVKASSPEARLEPLNQLFQQVRFFATRAGLSGCARIALLTSAFEALLFEIALKPERANASTSQTVAQAVDCLERLCQKSDAGIGEPHLKAKVLIVDDDPVNNLAMVAALKRVRFEPVSIEDPLKAIPMAEATSYDIVLLDINMPGMNGFELCEKLRALPQYKETPIVFVTASGDFQDRARGILSGGNDLIVKPVSPVELVLKTTMRLIQPDVSTPTPTPRPAENGSKHNGSSNGAPIPFTPSTPDWSNRQPGVPKVGNDGPSISTEMIRKAWIGESGTPTKPVEKPVPASSQDDVKSAPTEAKDESPKTETTATSATEDKPAETGETTKAATPEISIEPPKPVEEPKPEHVNGANKTVEPEALELKNEPPKVEVPAAVENTPAEAPTATAEKTDFPTTSQLNPVDLNMDTKTKPTIEDVARGVARIIFGDENINDMNVRLTRIALEKYTVPGTQKIDDVARGVTQIIFGDDKASEMNLRLTKIALEKYNIAEVLHLNGANGAPSL
jgi:CheY-like chemotaxis protein